MFLILIAGCGSITDDLYPSGSDKRAVVQPGTTGPGVGQNAPDFTIPDTLGTSVNLVTELSGTNVRGVVLYFTMWCPTCDASMSRIRDSIITAFPDILFFAVDYVSGSVIEVQIQASGFGGSGFRFLADIGRHVADSYRADMDTAVVINKSGVIKMNEFFKDTRLYNTLLEL